MSQDQNCRVESIPSRPSQIIQGELVHKLFITNYHETVEHHVQTCFILFRACIALYFSKIDSAQTPVAVAQGSQGNA